VCVFLSFMLGEDRVIKEFGLSLASAVFLDALIVRCLLLPATLSLLGNATWSLPSWLGRILPRVNIEGSLPPSGEGAAHEGQDAPHSTNGASPRAQPEVASEGAEI
ncbi:MAG TPA: hypothetical protein VFY36_06745, partial [Solirubrobacteraceae bacterium]|nr:hypothetical protein [Solirubrobacteraceae bacterium]